EYTKSGVTSTEGAVNAGEYDVIARFVVDERNYYPVDLVKEASVTVNKATIIANFPVNTSVSYNADDPVTYYPSLEEGSFLPYGVTCNISITKDGEPFEYCREPGAYKVTYDFDIDLENVNPFYDLVTNFRIYNIAVRGVITFEGYTHTYTKSYLNKDDQYTVTAQNVPDGVKVRYEYRKNGNTIGKAYWSKSEGIYKTEGTPWATHVGVYRVQAYYEPENPADCLDLTYSNTVTLEITPAPITVKHYEGESSDGTQIGAGQFYYDPETKTIEMVRGLLKFSDNYYPVKDIKVWYKPTSTANPVYLTFGANGDGFDNDEGYTYNFEVTYYYAPDDPVAVNDIAPKPSTGTFTYAQINKKKVIHAYEYMTFENESVSFDGQVHTIEVQNVPDGVMVTYVYKNADNQVVGNTGVSETGTYTVAAYFSVIDSDGYVVDVQRKQATLTITGE
ncbi:MAG: hypothetical protein SPL13_04240, partial [Clostridia bacterium]|nr:hypothetical protein [Clostridia bacterium]